MLSTRHCCGIFVLVYTQIQKPKYHLVDYSDHDVHDRVQSGKLALSTMVDFSFPCMM
jgi:hypothetical protein